MKRGLPIVIMLALAVSAARPAHAQVFFRGTFNLAEAYPCAVGSYAANSGITTPQLFTGQCPAAPAAAGIPVTDRRYASAFAVVAGHECGEASDLDWTALARLPALVFLMGGLAGVAAGFFGGWTDRIVSRIADTIMAFPLFVLAMGIVAALGNTVQNIIIATAIVNFPLYARIARTEANVRREAGFVQAARLSGNSEVRILLTQILPNIMPIMIVQMSLTMGYAILNAAGLSFIGLGVRPPDAEWGIMVAEGAAFMVSGEWWIAFFPGAALMVAVFCFNLLGDGLRDIVDPQRRT